MIIWVSNGKSNSNLKNYQRIRFWKILYILIIMNDVIVLHLHRWRRIYKGDRTREQTDTRVTLFSKQLKLEECEIPLFEAQMDLYGIVLFNIFWVRKANKNYGIFSCKIPYIRVLRFVYNFSESTCVLCSNTDNRLWWLTALIVGRSTTDSTSFLSRI